MEDSTKTEAASRLVSSDLLAALRSRLWARSEKAYCEYINAGRKDESLGWKIKVERGTFGRNELDAHCASAEKLGRTRALVEVCRELDALISANA